jgi:hypothetical protein
MKNIDEMLQEIENTELKEKLLKVYSDQKQAMMEMPASTKYHHSYKRGYHDHVQQVMFFAIRIYNFMGKSVVLDFSKDDIILMSFVHDMDKLEKYEETGEYKSGESKGKPKFAYELDWAIDPYAKVCLMLARYGILLTDEQLHALTFHAGGWSEFVKYGSDMNQLATMLHCADMLSAKCVPMEENLRVEEQL